MKLKELLCFKKNKAFYFINYVLKIFILVLLVFDIKSQLELHLVFQRSRRSVSQHGRAADKK